MRTSSCSFRYAFILLPLTVVGWLVSSECQAQTTWVFTQCSTNNPRAFNYSTDSTIPGDPIGPGFNITSTSTLVPPISTSGQLNLEGAIAVDKVHKTLWITDGVLGSTTVHITPINTSSCSMAAAASITVSGSPPAGIVTNLVGMDIEYQNVGGQDLPSRLWVASGFRYTWINVSFPGPVFSWHTASFSIPNGGFAVGDCAFAEWQLPDGAGAGSPSNRFYS